MGERVKQIMKSIDGVKQSNNVSRTTTSVELLRYQLEHSKRDNRKNVAIVALVMAIIAFVGGVFYGGSSAANVNAMNNANSELQRQVELLQDEVNSLKALTNQNQ